MKVVLMEAGALSAPCDSFELTGTLGKPGLPFGLEWLMLVGSFGVNWDQPIECGYELLDARFFRCPADSDSSFTFRVFFTEHDTTGRARIKGRMAELEEAIGDRNNSLKDVAAIAKLGRHKDLRPIEHAVLAEAFESGGDCDRYGDQLAAMERFGLSDPRYHEKFVSVCRMNAARAKTNSW